MANNSHKTAIKRQKLSNPTAYLQKRGFLEGDISILDYGCGRGDDVRILREMGYNVQSYDPYYFPNMPVGLFDVVICNFVMNTLPTVEERSEVGIGIYGKTAAGGVAYISVRNDKKELKGWTSKGTWQGYVEFGYPVVNLTPTYVMYSTHKGSRPFETVEVNGQLQLVYK